MSEILSKQVGRLDSRDHKKSKKGGKKQQGGASGNKRFKLGHIIWWNLSEQASLYVVLRELTN